MMTAITATEFRIMYKREGHVCAEYHYYMAESAEQAVQWQIWSMKAKGQSLELLSVEKYDRYADQWVDRSEVLSESV